MSKPGRYRNERHGIGGTQLDGYAKTARLLDAHPVYLPGSKSKGSCAKSSYDPQKNSLHLLKVMTASRTARQALQKDSDAPKVTWIFELANISTKKIVMPPRRCEMTERIAAMKNKTILDRDIYWRRAPY